MDTRFIESMIEQLGPGAHLELELLELLSAVADRQGMDASPDDLERAARFVTAYIGQVPYMMKVAWTSACNVGLEKQMKCILDVALSYWEEGDDVIPDELGVIGLMDDAYCSLTLLQAVSDNYRLLTGKHLFPDDLTSANQAMHRLIGEPYVSELETIVVRTMKEACIVQSVKKMAGEEKQINLDTQSTIWNHGPAGEFDIQGLESLGILKD